MICYIATHEWQLCEFTIYIFKCTAQVLQTFICYETATKVQHSEFTIHVFQCTTQVE